MQMFSHYAYMWSKFKPAHWISVDYSVFFTKGKRCFTMKIKTLKCGKYKIKLILVIKIEHAVNMASRLLKELISNLVNYSEGFTSRWVV